MWKRRKKQLWPKQSASDQWVRKNPHDIARLIELRRDSGLSNDDFCAFLKIHTTGFYRWQRGLTSAGKEWPELKELLLSRQLLAKPKRGRILDRPAQEVTTVTGVSYRVVAVLEGGVLVVERLSREVIAPDSPKYAEILRSALNMKGHQ